MKTMMKNKYEIYYPDRGVDNYRVIEAFEDYYAAEECHEIVESHNADYCTESVYAVRKQGTKEWKYYRVTSEPTVSYYSCPLEKEEYLNELEALEGESEVKDFLKTVESDQ